MQQTQFNDADINLDNLFAVPVKRKPIPRKWREIENAKAKLTLARELREIDPSFSFSQSDLI
jgi:hypothetical protein